MMIDNLEFLRNEATKIEKVLRKESGNNYKKYATLEQAYLTLVANINQIESYKKQVAAEEQRKKENQKAFAEAKKELEKENK